MKLKFNRGVFPAIQASIPYMRDWGFGNAGSNLDFFHDTYGDIAGGIWQPTDILSETKAAWTNYYARFILYVKQRSTLLEKWARYVSSREWMDESPGNLYTTTWRSDTIDLTYLGRGNWELTNLTAGDMSWNSIGYLYIIRDFAPYDHEIMFYDSYTGSGTTAKFHVTRRGLGNSTATLTGGTAVRWMFIPTGSFRFLLRSYSAQYPAWIAAVSFPKLVHDKLGLTTHDINYLGLSGGNPIYQMLPATSLDGSYGGTWGTGTGKYSNKYPADPGVTATVGVAYNDIVANPLMGNDNYIPLHTYDADNSTYRTAGSVVNKPSAGTKILFWTQGGSPTFGSLAFMGTDEVVLGNSHPNQGDLVEIVVGCKNREALLNSILRFEVMSRDLDEVSLSYTVQSVPTTFFYGPYPFKGFLHTGDVIEAAIGSWSNGPLGFNGLYR
ncbi:MAG: hypothetical protein A2580_14325 [Hydrogenophilales bacterium RIFOXYD1_FULL_62_11]|nr:MAG: hypothetical protein A2580_14325 [Hydrogenophilales bacterium RIFOXYD1_FULL_62_11]